MAEEVDRSHAWLLKPQTVLTAIVTVFLVISGITFLVLRQQYVEQQTHALASDSTAAQLLAELVDGQKKAALALLQSYARRPQFMEAVKRKDVPAAHQYLAGLKKDNDEIDLTFVTDPGGVLWANFPVFPESIGADLSYRDWYKGVSSGWRPYVSTVFQLIVGDKPLAVAIAVPVVDSEEKVIGILASSMRLTLLAETIRKVPLDPYTRVTVVDQAGNMAYSGRFPYADKVSPYPFFGQVKAALQAGKGHLEIRDPQNNKGAISAIIAPITPIGWTVIAEHSTRGIFRAVYRQFVATVITSLLLFVTLSLFLLYARKRSLLSETQRLLTTERQLREEEERYKELFASVGNPVAIYEAAKDGEDFIFRDFNPAAEKIEDVRREDVVGRSVLEVFPAVREFGLFEVFRRVWATGDPEYFPVAFYRDNRISGWRENYVYRLPSGEVVAVYEDMTARKQAEEALRESEDKFKYIFDHSPVGKSITLPSGQVNVNQSFCDMLGYAQEELRDRTWQEITYPDDIGLTEAALAPLLSGQRNSTRFMKRYAHKNGSIVWADVSTALRRDKDGNPLYFVTAVSDITERKKAEEEVRALNLELEQRVADRTARLEASNREMEAFSYSVSHDLRAPLRAMDGFSRIVLEEYSAGLPAEAQRYLKLVRENSQQMGRLIDDLLTFSRLGRQEPVRQRVIMRDVVKKALAELATAQEDRNAEITIGELPDCDGDPALLKQVWMNLIGNALKFTRPREAARIAVGSERTEAGETAYFVRDNGVGFDMRYAGKLFGVFQRLHRAEDFEGTGVGLAIVSRIVSRHGGRVRAEGKVGGGAAFYFTLGGGTA